MIQQADAPRDGFVYVVNTEGYVDEAMVSYRSLRRVLPDANVTFVTPPALFRTEMAEINWVALEGTYDSPFVKVEALNAPYERCIFLDSDTYVLGDISELFDILDGFDLAAAHEPMRGWDYETPAARAFVELNTGVLVFRKCPQVAELFARWRVEHDRMRSEQRLKNDQAAFRTALWHCHELRHATLSSEFHLITHKAMGIAWEARLLHGRTDFEEVAAQINQRLNNRAWLPGWGVVHSGDSRKQRLRTLARILRRVLSGMSHPETIVSRKAPVKWW